MRTVGRKRSSVHRSNIWRAAQAIAAGYKDAGHDYLSHLWVLQQLVSYFGHPQHVNLAKFVAKKIKDDPEKTEQILIEAFAQVAAETRTRPPVGLRDTDGWEEIGQILQSNTQPKSAPKKKDPIPPRPETWPFKAKSQSAPGAIDFASVKKRLMAERADLKRLLGEPVEVEEVEA